jgi:DNA-directed RNA polymerase subunit RPC12/RpoP
MIVVEVVAGVLVLALAVAVTWMGIFGLLGAIGCVRLRRCRSCGHLAPSATTPVMVCPYCRHQRLMHHRVHARLHHYFPGEW